MLRRLLSSGSEGELLRRVHDVLGMQRLAPLEVGYAPWSSSAMRPGAVALVLNEIAVNGRRSVVECGGGVSSLYVAALLDRIGDGHLHVLEHDEEWVGKLEGMLADRGLGNAATVVHAPLRPTDLALGEVPWYSTRVLEDRLGGIPVDLLVVDGPPAHTNSTRHARYPAVPFFRDRLGGDAGVVLDDVDRPGEREILGRWEEELGIPFERREAEAGTARGALGESHTV